MKRDRTQELGVGLGLGRIRTRSVSETSDCDERPEISDLSRSVSDSDCCYEHWTAAARETRSRSGLHRKAADSAGKPRGCFGILRNISA